MKTVFFRYILISISLLGFISGCGKDNKISSSSLPATSAINVKYNPVYDFQTVSDFATFKTKVQNGQFIIKCAPEVTYKMQEFSGEFFNRRETESIVEHPNGKHDSSTENSHLAIVTKLTEILNNVSTTGGYERLGPSGIGAAFKILDNRDKKIYIIDLNIPLVCNPIYMENESGNGYNYDSMLY